MKIRSYGLPANRHRVEKMDLYRRLLFPRVVERCIEPVTAEPREEPACVKCGCRRWIRLGEVVEPGRVRKLVCQEVDSS